MRVDVDKTYKLFLGGKFIRSESGRVYRPGGAPRTNVCHGSRKDLRDAVVAARNALPTWRGLTAYHRGQILYRLAEMLETRSDAMVTELLACTALTKASARKEVEACIDLCTWYAGIPDKLQQLLGSQNEVAGPFFNFSIAESTGVIGAGTQLDTKEQPALLGTLALLLPLLAGGNTVVQIVCEDAPLPGLALAEALATSDVPAGVVNLLAGPEDLLLQLASHRDVDGLLVGGEPSEDLSTAAADSVSRVRYADFGTGTWKRQESYAQLGMVEPFVEIKTLWHPTLE